MVELSVNYSFLSLHTLGLAFPFFLLNSSAIRFRHLSCFFLPFGVTLLYIVILLIPLF
jgi:hypothetical protein